LGQKWAKLAKSEQNGQKWQFFGQKCIFRDFLSIYGLFLLYQAIRPL